MSHLHPLCLFSKVASRLSSSGVPSHDFLHNFCSGCILMHTVVIFRHLNRFLLTYFHNPYVMWRDLAGEPGLTSCPKTLIFILHLFHLDRPKLFIFSLTLAHFIFLLPDSVDLSHTSYSTWLSRFVVVIAQQLFSYRQVSKLRKFATTARLSHRFCTVNCIRWLWQLNRCSTECGATAHSRQISAMPLVMRTAVLVSVQEPTVTRMQLCKCGTHWLRQQTFGWWDIGWKSSKDSVCLVQNLFKLLLRLLGCGGYVDRSVCVDICDAFVWEWHNLSYHRLYV